MFDSVDNKAISFPSSSKTDKVFSSNSAQTEEIVMKDASLQNVLCSAKATQTEVEESKQNGSPEYDVNSLVNFLRRITPKVEQELKKALRSRAFTGYSSDNTEEDIQAKVLHSLKWQQDTQTEHIITCLDWSSSGSVIGVGYGVGVHDSWCNHKSAVAFWNLHRLETVSNKPVQQIEISTCVTSISFHPKMPSLVAVGNKSGEIVVYDLTVTQDAQVVSAGDSEGVEITNLKWELSDPLTAVNFPHQRGSYILIATTSAGHILMWNTFHSKEAMTLINGFIITSQDIPRDIRSVSETGSVGITSITFHHSDPTIFYVGTDSGALFICSALSQLPSGHKLHGLNLYKCVTTQLSSHTGRVLTVDSSNFHRNAIHTLGTDKVLKLHSVLQPNKPAVVFHMDSQATCSKFVDSRPLTVIAGDNLGSVFLHTFGSGQESVPFKTTERPSPITTLSICKANVNLLAVGDQLGRVFIWNLPNSAVEAHPSEQSTLNDLISISDT